MPSEMQLPITKPDRGYLPPEARKKICFYFGVLFLLRVSGSVFFELRVGIGGGGWSYAKK